MKINQNTSEIFLIGLGSTGKKIVKEIENTNNRSFVYRYIDVVLNGDVNKEDLNTQWKAFCDPAKKSFQIICDLGYVDYSDLNYSLSKYFTSTLNDKISRDGNTTFKPQFALVAGLGGRTGPQTIVTLLNILNSDQNKENEIGSASFVVMPFNFEGPRTVKVADDCLSAIKNISDDETVFTFKNQDFIKLKGGKTTFTEAFLILSNEVKKKITNHFSIDSGEDIIPQTPSGYKTIQEVSEEIDVAANTLQFWETKIDKLFFSPLILHGTRYFSEKSLDFLKSTKYLVNQGVSFDQINKIFSELDDDELRQIPNKPEFYKNIIRPITKTKNSKKAHGWPFKKREAPPIEKTVIVVSNFSFRSFLLKLLKIGAYGFAVVLLVIGAFAAHKFYQLDNQKLHAALTQPNALVSIDDDGPRLRSCSCERTLKPSEVPETFKKALLAVEDKRFFQHFGFDVFSLARAVISLGKRGGGSTIEMQLAKNSIVQPTRDIIRKASEIVFAFRITQIFSKEDTLRLYASRVNFGNIGAIEINGLRSAANYYFAKKPEDINIQEAAILVSMLKSPYYYDPIKNPKNNLRRAKFILNLLFEKGMINKKDILSLEDHIPKRGTIKPYRDRFFEDLIISETKKLNFDKGTYRIILSVDPIAQMQALNILERQVRSSKNLGVARASLVSLAESGAIKAIVGGQDYLNSAYNLATQAERQAASTLKIVTYLAALESGYNKKTRVFDDQTKITADVFIPRNYDQKYAGRITLEECFAKSKNVCTVDVATRLTNYPKLSEMAQRLRITDGKINGSSIVLGATETTLLKNTAAFASIKNEGNYTQPFLLRFVLDEYGYLFHEHSPNKEKIFEKRIALQMTELLDKVVSPAGTANSALIPGHKTFGKTGTSQRNRDAWFVGFSEHGVTTGIWVGPADDKTMKGVSGGGLPSDIFRKFNQNLYERYESCKSDTVFQSEGYARDINC